MMVVEKKPIPNRKKTLETKMKIWTTTGQKLKKAKRRSSLVKSSKAQKKLCDNKVEMKH